MRVLHAGKPVTVDAAWWRLRLQAALERRRGLFDEQTTGYRWIHGESDGWPGLVLDRYGAVLVLKDPLQAEHFEKPTDYYLGIKTHEDHGILAKLVEDAEHHVPVDPNNPVDPTTSDPATLSIPVGLLTGDASLTVKDTVNTYPAGDKVGFIVSVPGAALLNLAALQPVTVTAINNGTDGTSAGSTRPFFRRPVLAMSNSWPTWTGSCGITARPARSPQPRSTRQRRRRADCCGGMAA